MRLHAAALLLPIWLAPLACCPSAPPSGAAAPRAAASQTAAATTTSALAPAASSQPGPPLARREKLSDMIHGTLVRDPYRWLEDPSSAETKQWLAQMDGYCRGALDALPERGALTRRLTELSYIESVSPPHRRGSRYFFSRRHKDKEKRVWYWRQGKQGKPAVLLDPNTMSADGSVALKGVWPSYDGKRVAYKLSENNADEATMYLMDVASRKVSAIDTIAGAKYASASWDPPGRGFYYTWLPVDPTIPAAERPGYAEIRYHQLGTKPDGDRRVFPKTGDPEVFIDAELSRDGHYLFVYKYHGWTRTDVYYRDLRKHGGFQPFAVGLDAKFWAYEWQGHIYLHTNYQAPRWRVMLVDPHHVERDRWHELVAQRDDAVLEDLSVRGGRLVLRYLHNASSRLEVATLQGAHLRTIALPGIGSVHGPVGNPEDDDAYYAFSSFTTPTTVYETSIESGASKPYFTLEVPVDPKPYVVEQVWYRSKDSTRVSMFIIRAKSLVKDGRTPFLLQGYGGFNINMTPAFNAPSFAWLEHGGAMAIPNLRGGGEYGEAWHRAGMRANKQNVFDDFIAAAEYLIAQGYTRADRLGIYGASNGGLLVGAVMVQRPELFRAVACGVPLLDMIRYHLVGAGKTWISEYGSADDPQMFPVLYAYSPYHHVTESTAYPALLMLTADNDDRVAPMHARKFAAAVRHATSSGHPVLVRVERHAGHGGGDMVKKEVARRVDLYSFLFHELGMNRTKRGAD